MAQAEKVFKDLLCDGRSLATEAADPNDARVIDELRKQLLRLKSDLEAEKQKTRAQQSAHNTELKKLREEHEKRFETALENALRKKDLEKQFELKKLEDALLRQKDQELKTLTRDKDEELKKLQRKMSKDCEDQVRQAVDAERKFAKEHIETLISGGPVSERESNLTREMFVMGEQVFQLESQTQTLRQENKALAEQIRRLKADHEVEVQDLLRQTKAEAQRDMAQLKLAERIISEKEQDLQAIRYHAQVAIEEKEALVEELTVVKGLRSSLGNVPNGEMHSDESFRQLAVPKLPGSSGLLQKRIDELESILRKSEDEKMEMKHENASLRKKLVQEKVDDSSEGSKSVKQLEEKVKQLRKKNADLVTLAKSVEDKYKALKHENEQLQTKVVVPADCEQQVKKSLSRQHAKDISEYTKQIHTKDKEIEKLKQKLAKHEVEGTSKVAEGTSLLEKNFKAMAMEKLRMEKIMSRLYAQLPDIEQIENITKKDLEAGVLKEQVERLTEENEQLKKRLEAMSPRPPTGDSVDRPQDSPMSELQQSTSVSEGSQDNAALLEALESRSEGTASRGTASGNRGEELGAERGKPEEGTCGMRPRVGETDMDCLIRVHASEKANLEAKISELSEYKNDCAKLQEQLKELQEEGQAKDKKIRQLEELKVQTLEIGHELEVTQERCTKLEAELATLRMELSQREAKIGEVEMNMKTEREQRVNELGLHKSNMEQLESAIATKERYCESLRSTLEELQKLVDTREGSHVHTDGSTQTDATTFGVGSTLPGSPSAPPRGQPSASSPAPSDHALQGARTSSNVDLTGSTAEGKPRPTSASSIRMGGGGSLTHSSSSLDASLQSELKKAGFDATDPFEAIDCFTQSATSLTSDTDRKPVAANANDTHESLESAEGSGNLPQLSPDKNSGGLSDGLGKRCSVGEEDEDLFHSVVERIEPVTTEMAGVQHEDAQKLEVEDVSLADPSDDQVRPPSQSTSLFIARFSYKPSESSPNPNYDQELAITAGEYLYVVGEEDEDGFYMARLMNGQTGMVPSNYVEKVGGEDGTCDDVQMNETPPETPPTRRKSVNLDKIPEGEEGEEDEEEEKEEEEKKKREKNMICPPHRIELLKQFVEGRGYTIAIKWELPPNLPQDATGYNVYVNGDIKLFVSNPLETTVMLLDIPRHTRVKISLQTVTSSSLQSELSQPLILNPQYPDPPSSVQVSKGEGNAALIVSWPGVVLDAQVEGDSPVTGYALYLNGTKCAELLGPQTTKDKEITCQALLEPLDVPASMLKVRPASMMLTVRSLAAQYESSDSAPVQLDKEMCDILLGDGRDFLSSKELLGSHIVNGVHHDNGSGPKYFKALYDYNPIEQSQNDGPDEELAFTAGDIILAKTSIDEDGFFEGELNGRCGLVPANLVEEVAAPVSNGPSHQSVNGVNGSGEGRHLRGDGVVTGTGPQQVVAIYDYNPSKDSPNVDGAEVELGFHAGDLITIYGKADNGFIQGELGGRKGLVPVNYIESLQQDHKAEEPSSAPMSLALEVPIPVVSKASVQGEAPAKTEKKKSFLQLLRRKKET